MSEPYIVDLGDMKVHCFTAWEPVGGSMWEAMSDYMPGHPLTVALRRHYDPDSYDRSHHVAVRNSGLGPLEARCYTCDLKIWDRDLGDVA